MLAAVRPRAGQRLSSNRSRDERWLDASGNLALSQTGNWLRRRLDLNGDGNFNGGGGELDDTSVFSLAYDADTGRWSRRDPLGYVDGMSLYEYVRGRPLVATDPRGLVAATCGASCQPSQPTTPSPPATTPHPGEPPAAQPPECPTPTIVVPPNFREPESIKDPARKRCLEYCAEGGLARMFCHDGKPYICVCPANIKKRFPDGGDDFREQYRSCVEAHEKQNWRHHVCDPDNPNADPKENPNHKGKAACNEAEAYRLEVQCARRIKCNTKACEDAKSDAIAEAACLQALWMRACRGGPEPTVEEGNACRQRK